MITMSPSYLFFAIILFMPGGNEGNMLGNIFLCSPSAEYILHECHKQYEMERYEFGGDYCCIYAKFRECLNERLAISCRRSIQQLVDATIGIDRPRECIGVYYPSIRCWLFYNIFLLALIVGIIGLAFLGILVVLCYKCLARMYPQKEGK